MDLVDRSSKVSTYQETQDGQRCEGSPTNKWPMRVGHGDFGFFTQWCGCKLDCVGVTPTWNLECGVDVMCMHTKDSN